MAVRIAIGTSSVATLLRSRCSTSGANVVIGRRGVLGDLGANVRGELAIGRSSARGVEMSNRSGDGVASVAGRGVKARAVEAGNGDSRRGVGHARCCCGVCGAGSVGVCGTTSSPGLGELSGPNSRSMSSWWCCCCAGAGVDDGDCLSSVGCGRSAASPRRCRFAPGMLTKVGRSCWGCAPISSSGRWCGGCCGTAPPSNC